MRHRDPKSVASGRPTPLSPAATALLRRHRAVQAQRQLEARSWADTGHVFTTLRGTPLEGRNVARAFRLLLEDQNIPTTTGDGHGRGLHELRRTFATRLRDADVPLEDVQRLGRWASPQVLLAHYAAVDSTRLRHAADVAADGIGG